MIPKPPSSILYDARTVQPGMSGVGRYTLNLLKALAALPETPPIRALFYGESLQIARRDPELKHIEPVEAPVSHESHPASDLWMRTGLPRMMRAGELYHGPAFVIPGGGQRFTRVVTIHDLFVFTHPRYFSAKFRTWMRWKIRRACRFADRIIVPTSTVRDQLIQGRFAPGSRIQAIFEAPDATAPLWDAPAKAAGGRLERLMADPSRPKILTIGTQDPRKDPATARAACLRLAGLLGVGGGKPPGVDWLWIGGPGSVEDDTPQPLRWEAARAGFQTVGHVPGESIRPALNATSIYVTCSRTEGFGIPLAEAMAAGCPIIASDIPVHREVAGDAALYFPEGDPETLALALERLLADASLRESLAARGRARAPLFDWRAAAERTLKVYIEAHESRVIK